MQVCGQSLAQLPTCMQAYAPRGAWLGDWGLLHSVGGMFVHKLGYYSVGAYLCTKGVVPGRSEPDIAQAGSSRGLCFLTQMEGMPVYGEHMMGPLFIPLGCWQG
jgi:hypothetical protein